MSDAPDLELHAPIEGKSVEPVKAVVGKVKFGVDKAGELHQRKGERPHPDLNDNKVRVAIERDIAEMILRDTAKREAAAGMEAGAVGLERSMNQENQQNEVSEQGRADGGVQDVIAAANENIAATQTDTGSGDRGPKKLSFGRRVRTMAMLAGVLLLPGNAAKADWLGNLVESAVTGRPMANIATEEWEKTHPQHFTPAERAAEDARIAREQNEPPPPRNPDWDNPYYYRDIDAEYKSQPHPRPWSPGEEGREKMERQGQHRGRK